MYCAFCPTRAVTGLWRLPKDAVKKQKWLEILQIKFDTKLTPNSRVCHKHFCENSFTNSKIRKKTQTNRRTNRKSAKGNSIAYL